MLTRKLTIATLQLGQARHDLDPPHQLVPLRHPLAGRPPLPHLGQVHHRRRSGFWGGPPLAQWTRGRDQPRREDPPLPRRTQALAQSPRGEAPPVPFRERERDTNPPRCIRPQSRDASLPKLTAYPLHIASENNFPTAAGLASSASGLAALIATISQLYSLTPQNGISISDLSRIARQGSGSACRSMFGGYVAWEMGQKEDGSDSVAVEVAPASHWPDLHALILVVSDKKKGTPSTAGMQRTVATSDLLQHRIDKVVPARMQRISQAILDRDFDQFAVETMADSNQFHAVCLDTQPPIFYLNDVSRAVIQLVTELNRASVDDAGRGYVAAYTYDAGPNAVLYIREPDVDRVLRLVEHYFPQSASSSSAIPTDIPAGFNAQVIPQHPLGSVARIIHTKVGDGPRVLESAQHGLLDPQSGLPKSVVASAA